MKLKLLELFGGIGACSKALQRLGIDYEIADYVEIDKYAVASYNAIHNTNFEPQDITQWDKDIEVDLIMHGSPCQSISLAGLQHGADKGSGTRSSLMWETVRIVEKLKPKYVIWENVKNLLSKKHRHNFDAYLEKMSQLGYTNYYQVLNAKDYGIPQNRERIFTISILKEKIIYDDYNSTIRQDQDTIGTLTCNCGASAIRNGWKIIEHNQNFTFPPKQELKLKLKDMLEDEVDEKYYLSDKMINFFYKNEQVQKEKGNGFRFGVSDGNVIAKAVTTRAGSRMDDNFIIGSTQKHAKVSTDGVVPTLTSAMGQGGGHIPMHNYDLRIRKLTPKECWRLMGFDDEDYEKASKVNSNTQLYKQAGNSIVVNVLEAILKNLLFNSEQTEQVDQQITIYDYLESEAI